MSFNEIIAAVTAAFFVFLCIYFVRMTFKGKRATSPEIEGKYSEMLIERHLEEHQGKMSAGEIEAIKCLLDKVRSGKSLSDDEVASIELLSTRNAIKSTGKSERIIYYLMIGAIICVIIKIIVRMANS